MSSGDNIVVYGRFRPSSKQERDEEEKISSEDINEPRWRSTQEITMKRGLISKQKQPFKAVLDHIFKCSTTQKKIFDKIGRPMVQAVIEGYNATIFAYGQTGSGKTYTMFGPEKRKTELDLGLVQRCCNYLFDKLKKLIQGVTAQLIEYQVQVSFVQIYKKDVYDLLDPESNKLSIKTNHQRNLPFVDNLKIISVHSVQDILINLKAAFGNRKVAKHKLNNDSSRSHMLVQLNVEQKLRDGTVKRSKLNFGDLAGSEDITKALGPNPDPIRLKEAIEINSSLTALTTAINFLSRGQRPSYRSSKLTHILQDSLGGNSKTSMIVTCSPHITNRAETIRTLNFAMTAKKVKNKAKVVIVQSRSQLIRRIQELEAMNSQLKARVIELEQQLRSNGFEVGSLEITSFSDDEKAQLQETKVVKKKMKKTELSYSTTSIHQIDVLRQEIDAANMRTKKQQERNTDLEKMNMDLSIDIESMEEELRLARQELDKLKGEMSNFMNEREIMEQRNDELQNELSVLQDEFSKSKDNMDKQLQRQRNNINMRQTEKKELQKIVQELNLQNESLLQQNELMMKQMHALKKSNKDNIGVKSQQNKPEMNGNEVEDYDNDLNEEEQSMEPAELLLHRFAAAEANDFRLSKEQRMTKTAKMMEDLSEDIDDLMDQWLPKDKIRRNPTKSKHLVFRVRQLIGHFNVLVKQMKSTEESYQNDLRLDIKRRDVEIRKLKQDQQMVHKLKDDLLEKDDEIEQLKKLLQATRAQNEQLKTQTVTQQDTIFDVQSQVRYLQSELTKGNSSIKELKEKLEKVQSQQTHKLSIDSDYADFADDSDTSSGSGEEESKSNNNTNDKNKTLKRSIWRESIKAGDRVDCKRESGAWCTGQIIGYRKNENTLQIRYDGWGQQYDEYIDRGSSRLAVYKSMTKLRQNNNNNNNNNNLIKDGYMLKEGKMFKTWRKRYFTLNRKGILYYYQNRGDENPIGSVNIKTMRKTKRMSFGKTREFGLELYTDNRTWKFLCGNDKDLAEWIQAFNLDFIQ